MNWQVRNPLHCTTDGCTAKAEIEALRAQVAALTVERDTLNAALDAKITICGDGNLAIAQARIAELREALEQWDALIKHQYTGTREGMSDMQHASNATVKALTTPDDSSALDAALKADANKWADMAMAHGCTYMVTKIRSMK